MDTLDCFLSTRITKNLLLNILFLGWFSCWDLSEFAITNKSNFKYIIEQDEIFFVQTKYMCRLQNNYRNYIDKYNSCWKNVGVLIIALFADRETLVFK